MQSNNQDPISKVFGGIMSSPSIRAGLTNLSQLPALDIENQLPDPYRDKRFTPAYMGFKFFGKELKIAFAASGAMSQHIPAAKFIAMVELMHDPKHSTVVLQSSSFPAKDREGRGQVVGRILPANSAINIAHGKVGVPISGIDDILHLDSYQIDKVVLGSYYLAAKFQIGNESTLDSLFAAYEGFRFYDLPTGRDEAVDMSVVAELIG